MPHPLTQGAAFVLAWAVGGAQRLRGKICRYLQDRALKGGTMKVTGMSDLWPLAILIAYFAVMRWVLPRFGVST